MKYDNVLEPEEFAKVVGDLKKSGKSEREIADELGMHSIPSLRAIYSYTLKLRSKNLLKRYRNLKEAGYSREKIADVLGFNESTIRAMEKQEELNTAN